VLTSPDIARTSSAPADVAPFELSAVYWPPDAGTFWIEAFHPDRVRSDFAVASSLGIRHLEIKLLWSDFQPNPNGVSLDAMRLVEKVLTYAEDADLWIGLHLLPLVALHLIRLPIWATNAGELGEVPILSGNYLSRRQVRNLFEDGDIVEAQCRMIGELVRAFGPHPRATRWTLADQVPAASLPRSSDAYARWPASVAETARRAYPAGRSLHAVSTDHVTRHGTVDL